MASACRSEGTSSGRVEATATESGDRGAALSPGQGSVSVPNPPATAAVAPLDALKAIVPVRGTVRLVVFGDMGAGAAARATVRLARDLMPDLVLVVGDFDYMNDPARWIEVMRAMEPVPWIGVVGNHDVSAWSGYAPFLARSQASIPDLHCVGEPGRRSNCVFRGIRIVLSEIGTMGQAAENEAFIEQALRGTTENWRFCGWHKNQADMQLGYKMNEVGWRAYQLCEAAGALIVTGHEHSYARTRTLTRVGRTKDHGGEGSADLLTLGPGRTAVFVAGYGGVGLRGFSNLLHDDDTWWAAYYTADRVLSRSARGKPVARGDTGGVLVFDLGVEGRPGRGVGTFVLNQTRTAFDRFELESAVK